MAGAEKLVGKGDMLLKIGGGKPVRVQGNFISDQEVNDVIEFVKSQGSEVEYADDVIQSIDKVGAPQAADDGDELLADAIETVVLAGNASASMLQRRFRIGYNRAARIIDMMEARGIIGPSEGSKPRQVLMTEDELRGLTEDTEDLGE
jgi:S-DNA-T family DNA segregation ATPase FtsK/SpoIIIE